MNYKILFKSLKFAFLPTFSVLMLLFFAFFSISDTLAFIGSDNWIAIVLRIVLFIAEIALVYYMYVEYAKEGLLESVIEDSESIVNNVKISSIRRSPSDYIHELFHDDRYNSDVQYRIFKTKDSDIKIIKRVKLN